MYRMSCYLQLSDHYYPSCRSAWVNHKDPRKAISRVVTKPKKPENSSTCQAVVINRGSAVALQNPSLTLCACFLHCTIFSVTIYVTFAVTWRMLSVSNGTNYGCQPWIIGDSYLSATSENNSSVRVRVCVRTAASTSSSAARKNRPLKNLF